MTVPYPMVAAVAPEIRHQQMLVAIKRGYPRLGYTPIDDTRTLHVACYGPSLEDTWKDLGRPLASMSGATRWLAERGVIADYHVECDPRAHKVKFIDPPVPGVHYLMASVCHPSVWDILEGQRVTLWHVRSSDETEALVAEHDSPDAYIISVGMHVGLAAIHVGGMLGFRHFEIHGMDGSFRDGDRHVGVHYGKAQKDDIFWDAGRVTYRTSKIMADQVHVTLQNLRSFPMFCVFHGHGLQQALVREAGLDNACCADEIDKAARVRSATAVIYPAPPADYHNPVEAEWAKFRAIGEHERARMERFAVGLELSRESANYKTGTITVDAMVLLRGMVNVLAPRIIAEVGTFIGRSTCAMLCPTLQRLWTCDRSNNCLYELAPILTHPFRESTDMFAKMVEAGERVDLFFFDGRIQLPDVALILRLAKPTTVFVFDDYVGEEKGVANVKLLAPFLPKHGLLPPPAIDGVTLAALLAVA